METEKHYTIDEIGELWGMKHDTAQRLFRNEPGVLRVSTGEGKRSMLRVPQSVLERVHRRMQNPEKMPVKSVTDTEKVRRKA